MERRNICRNWEQLLAKEPNCKDRPQINLQSKLDGEKCICVNLCVFISVTAVCKHDTLCHTLKSDVAVHHCIQQRHYMLPQNVLQAINSAPNNSLSLTHISAQTSQNFHHNYVNRGHTNGLKQFCNFQLSWYVATGTANHSHNTWNRNTTFDYPTVFQFISMLLN